MNTQMRTKNSHTPQPTPLRAAFVAAAAGRVAWGAAAVASPSANLRVAGVPGLATPEVTYLTRVFGARALAIGLGYLGGDADTRIRWQRLGLLIDSLDTVGGLITLRRIDDRPRRRAASLMVAITGSYAALGVTGMVHAALSRRATGSIERTAADRFVAEAIQ